jgi:3-oxoacyl-[acyl-carrier-protein] synthase-1
VNIEELDPLAKDLPIVTKRIDNIEVKTAISNSFGFGGTNACLVFSTKNL